MRTSKIEFSDGGSEEETRHSGGLSAGAKPPARFCASISLTPRAELCRGGKCVIVGRVRDNSGVIAEGLHKSFGPVKAVRGVDLNISPGEVVALLGPNGAGKTTTIDMILGLGQPDAGRVTLWGMPPAEAVHAGIVGGMLQTGTLIGQLSVRELVTMVGSLYPEPLPVEEALSLSGASEFADRPTNKLSGGQTQRVRFAVALVANSDLLVLDEPTVALDVEGRRDFWVAMREFATAGRTVLFATHYLEEADQFADRIILMARGLIVADGPTTEIKAKVGLRAVRATLPGADHGALATLSGVQTVEIHGDSIVLRCTNSDLALRALLPRFPEARDIEVHGAGLEEAFLELTEERPELDSVDDRAEGPQ